MEDKSYKGIIKPQYKGYLKGKVDLLTLENCFDSLTTEEKEEALVYVKCDIMVKARFGKVEDEAVIFKEYMEATIDKAKGESKTANAQPVEQTETISINENNKNSYITNIEVLNVLPSLYAFLVKEKVINSDNVTCTDYTTAIEKADISDIYSKSVKYKFKTSIKAIQKCFTADWFEAVCKSAGVTKESMGKWNFSDDTASRKWFNNLNKIVATL